MIVFDGRERDIHMAVRGEGRWLWGERDKWRKKKGKWKKKRVFRIKIQINYRYCCDTRVPTIFYNYDKRKLKDSHVKSIFKKNHLLGILISTHDENAIFAILCFEGSRKKTRRRADIVLYPPNLIRLFIVRLTTMSSLDKQYIKRSWKIHCHLIN